MTTNLSGPAFPFQIENGAVARSNGLAKFRENLRGFIATRIGERLMRRNYGSGVHEARDEFSSQELSGFVRFELEAALARYFPAIVIDGQIDVFSKNNALQIRLNYRLPPDALIQELLVQL